uniref:Uncharacterized protein n=1 Tax=Arundo donax TaxID=35708 RepID=A0A0A9EYM9_ARUDO
MGKGKSHINIVVIGQLWQVDHHWPPDLQAWRH